MLKTLIGFLFTAALLTGCAPNVASMPMGSGQAETATTQTATITAEEAKTIALEHVKLTADQVTGLRAELDRDDGRLEWDVDFRSSGYEYDYTIDAKTGNILDVDKDLDD